VNISWFDHDNASPDAGNGVLAPRQGLLSGDSRAYQLVKRGSDIVLSSLALATLAPVFAVVAAAIAVESRGPVFYRQERVGRGGKAFGFYKFRSMVVGADAMTEQLAQRNEADGPIFKIADDPRVTRVGKFLRKTSLDEIPQFWNVLKGDLSLVGPRPHLPKEVAQYLPHHHERLQATPGLVCYREVAGRSRLTFEQWVALDIQYVRTRSVATDARILLRAVPAILKGEGAC
jgi:lipopolysaccharide/colanic/teichoic acid biosynthesis glycosyltransferase